MLPLSVLQDEPRDHPSGRDDVRSVSAFASERGGSFARARHRHQSRDGSILMEQICPIFAAEIRKNRAGQMRAYSNWQWHLDEVFVKINGETHYL